MRGIPPNGVWLQNTTTVLVLIVTLLVMQTQLTLGASHRCELDICTQQYDRAVDMQQVVKGPSPTYCYILRNYSECLRSLRGCRSNLNYHAISGLVQKWYGQYNCSHLITLVQTADNKKAGHSVTPTRVCTHPGSSKQDVVYCALFGDPHLRTFAGTFQTCAVHGAWPLISNAYIAVQVTNERVGDGTATVTTKLTVLVKEHPEIGRAHV